MQQQPKKHQLKRTRRSCPLRRRTVSASAPTVPLPEGRPQSHPRPCRATTRGHHPPVNSPRRQQRWRTKETSRNRPLASTTAGGFREQRIVDATHQLTLSTPSPFPKTTPPGRARCRSAAVARPSSLGFHPGQRGGGRGGGNGISTRPQQGKERSSAAIVVEVDAKSTKGFP